LAGKCQIRLGLWKKGSWGIDCLWEEIRPVAAKGERVCR
jgi:hypothetical protein